MPSNSPTCSFFVSTASSGWLSWTCSSKELRFIVLLLRFGLVGFSRVNMVTTARVGVRVSIRFRVSLVLVIGLG